MICFFQGQLEGSVQTGKKFQTEHLTCNNSILFPISFSLFYMLLFSCSIKLNSSGFYLIFISTLANRLKSGPRPSWATCLPLYSKSLHFATFFDAGYLYSTFFPSREAFTEYRLWIYIFCFSCSLDIQHLAFQLC